MKHTLTGWIYGVEDLPDLKIGLYDILLEKLRLSNYDKKTLSSIELELFGILECDEDIQNFKKRDFRLA